MLGGSFLTLRTVDARSMRFSDAKEAKDCDLLSEAIAEEVVLPARLRRFERPVGAAWSDSDLTWAADVEVGAFWTSFLGFPFNG